MSRSELAELRAIRHEISDLRDSVEELHHGATPDVLNFFTSEIPPTNFSELWTWVTKLKTEYGADFRKSALESRNYSELYFLEFIEERRNKLDDYRNGLDMLRMAICCEENLTAYQKLLFSLFQSEFRMLNKASIDPFKNIYKNAQLIVVHISCAPRIDQAFRSAESFSEEDPAVRNLIVVGQTKHERENYIFDPATRVLTVPAGDSYEALPQKVAAVHAFLSFSGNLACILKVDDDIRCTNNPALLSDLLPATRAHDYLGKVWNPKVGGMARTWHFDKCQDPSINRTPYTLFADSPWAAGPAYALSPRAVHVLGKASVYLRQVFETELYEDVAVGKVLSYHGILPSSFHLSRRGILKIDAETGKSLSQ